MAKGGSTLQDIGMILAPQATQGILNAPLMQQQRDRMMNSGNALDQLIQGLSGNQPAQNIDVNGSNVAVPAMKMSTQTQPQLPQSAATGRMAAPNTQGLDPSMLGLGGGGALPAVPEILTAKAAPGAGPNIGSPDATPLTGGMSPTSGMANFMQNQVPGLAFKADPETMIKSMQQRAVMSSYLDRIPDLSEKQRAAIMASPDAGMKAYVDNVAFPTVPDNVKLLSVYNGMPDNDPRKALLKNEIDKAGGIETDQLKRQETQASIGEKGANAALSGAKLKLIQDSGLDDDTLSRIYDGVHAGQKITDIYPNIGRGQQGAAQSVQIQKYITNRMKAEGMTQAQIASAQVNLKAQTGAAAMAAKRGTGIDIGADELQTFGDQALEAADALGNGNFVPWNQLSNMADSSISDPKLASLKTALQGVKGAYATILTRGGANNVDAQKKSDDLLNAANGIPAIKAIIAQMKREAIGAKAATVNVQGEIGARIAGGSPTAGAPASAPSTTPDGNHPAAAAAGLPAPAQRVQGQTYDTPRGKMQWTGTGWIPAAAPTAAPADNTNIAPVN